MSIDPQLVINPLLHKKIKPTSTIYYYLYIIQYSSIHFGVTNCFCSQC